MKNILIFLFALSSLFVSAQCTVLVTDVQVACEGYTWIDGNSYNSENYEPITTIGEKTPELFSETTNETWTNVFTSCLIGDGNNGQQQTLTINIVELPMGEANYRVVKTMVDGNFFNGDEQPLELGLNTINVLAPENPWGDRTVKFQFSSEDIKFSMLSSNGNVIYQGASQTLVYEEGCDTLIILDLTFDGNPAPGTEVVSICNSDSYTWSNSITYTESNYVSTTTIDEQTPELFANGPNESWTSVYTACIIGDGNNGVQQTLNINITSLPAEGVDYRVVKTVANGNFNLGDPQPLSLGYNTLNVVEPQNPWGDRVVKFQFSNNAVEFDELSLNGDIDYSGIPSQVLTTTSGCDSIVTLDLSFFTINTLVDVLDESTLQAQSVEPGIIYQWVDCNNNFAPIDGATNSTFISENSGDFAVELTLNNCSALSDCFTISSTTVIDDIDKHSEIQLFPNPTTNELTISLDGVDVVDIIILDIQGKVMSKQSDLFDQDRIDLSSYGDGTYLIKIMTPEEIRVIRVAKR